MADTRPKEPNQRELAAAGARNRILAATADCIVRDGLAKVRMAGIARAAGVSAGLLHYHFDTKEQLFADVLTYSHEVSGVLNEQAMQSAGDRPAQRLSSFLDRCLPSDERLAHEWLLWQELALLCIRQPDLAKVGAELYEDLYATIAGLITEGVESGAFHRSIDPRMVAETAVALCDGLGSRVLANDPNLSLSDARATLAVAVGVLVGHDGPLPEPAGLVAGSRP
ncbi:MAG: TetR family transcriptional regulator [Marmoricola sp.]|jgi:AcrR family transcriptional regulator|nr:TetR family transcriptional regulator [Marmoricola sp.]